jgi:hypothetical protein
MSDGHGLALAVAITAGADREPDAMLIARAACTTDGPPRQSPFSILENVGHLEPGETVFADGIAFSRDGLPAPSARCTIELGARASDGSTPAQPFASRCFERGQLTEGACEGLVPGPVTIRVDVAGQATLVRGAHVEGPFELGTAPSPEAVAPILASIEQANDDRAIVSAASATAQTTVLPLLEALRAASIEVAIEGAAIDDTAADDTAADDTAADDTAADDTAADDTAADDTAADDTAADDTAADDTATDDTATDDTAADDTATER